MPDYKGAGIMAGWLGSSLLALKYLLKEFANTHDTADLVVGSAGLLCTVIFAVLEERHTRPKEGV